MTSKETSRRGILKIFGFGAIVLGIRPSHSAFALNGDLPRPKGGGPIRRAFGGTPFPASPCRGRAIEFEGDARVVKGALPHDLRGHVFFVESLDTPERANLAAGQGLILRIDFDEGGALMKRRRIRTASVLVGENLAGTKHAFKSLGLAQLSMFSLGALNACNTSVLSLSNGRMALTYDGGAPHEIDPVSLDVMTPIGRRAEWRQALPEIIQFSMAKNWPFALVRATAHPFHDPVTNTFFTVNFGGLVDFQGLTHGNNPFTHIVMWDGEGALQHFPLADEKGHAVRIRGAVHSLCVTREHVIVLDTPLSLEAESMLGLQDTTRPQEPDTIAWIATRKDMTLALEGKNKSILARKVVIQREWEHVMADFNDEGGIITLHGASSPASDFSECLMKGDVRADDGTPVRRDLLGMLPAPLDLGELGRFRIRVTAKTAELLSNETRMVHDDALTWGISLPTWRGNQATPERFTDIYWVSFGFHSDLDSQRMRGVYDSYRHRLVPYSELPTEGRAPALFRIDCETMEIADAFPMPPGRFLASPQFVPREHFDAPTKPAARPQQDGYIVCTVMADTPSAGLAANGDEIWIFDAANLSAGPLCILAHDSLDFAFTLHSTWTPRITHRQATYRVRAQDDYADIFARLSPDVRAAFEKAVFPVL